MHIEIIDEAECPLSRENSCCTGDNSLTVFFSHAALSAAPQWRPQEAKLQQ